MLPIRIDLPDNVQSKPLGHPDDATAHIERVLAIAEGHPSALSDDEVATSWQRSANAHSIDPASREPPRILTSSELKDLREPLAKVIVDAHDELTASCGGHSTLSSFAMFKVSRSIIVATKQKPINSSIGERGSAACGLRRSKGPMALAPA